MEDSNKNSIHSIMLSEHKKIDELLEKCKKSLLNPVALKINFKKLFNQIQEHFFIEEKVIFSVYEKAKNESDSDVMSINLKPHSLECGRNFRVLNFGSQENCY